MEPVQLTIDGVDGATDEASRPLKLRIPGEADLPRIAEMFADPSIVAHTLVSVPWTRQDREAYLAKCRDSWREGQPRWVITDAATDDVLGTVGLQGRRFETEIVYLTAPWARRRQVALRACHAAIDFGFQRLGVSRMTWGAITGNHLSRLIALRLGFNMEGIARNGIVQRGVPADVWVAAMLPGELRDLTDPPQDYPLRRRQAVTFATDQPRITTDIEGLSLRPLTENDIEPIVRTSQDPGSLRWTTVPRPYRPQHAESFVRGMAPAAWRQGTGALFALADAEDAYCGTIDIRLHSDDPYEGDIGCVTAPWARGRGYMSAATRALCRFGFESLGLERIEWHAHTGNAASIRVAEKAGFVAEGTVRAGLRHFDERRDVWQGARLRSDDVS